MKKINTYYESLVQCTKLSKKQQKKLIYWFSKQNTEVQIDIFNEQKNQFFKLKGKCKELQTVPLAAFLSAIEHFYLLELTINSKNKQNDLATTKKSSEFAIKKAKKEKYKEKRERLLNLWSIVKNLKSEEYSYRDVSNYLRGHHRFEVSHAYIRNIWKELENGG